MVASSLRFALMGATRLDGRLVAAVLAGFAGQLSGMLAALAHLQVTALGRAGEPAQRIVSCLCLGAMVVGAAAMLLADRPRRPGRHAAAQAPAIRCRRHTHPAPRKLKA